MLANVQQTTIRPIIEGVVAPGSCIHTDEYSIYARLTQGDRISNLSEDFGEICVLPSRPLDLDAQGAL